MKAKIENLDLTELRELGHAVRDKHGRPWAVNIIRRIGKAGSLAEVKTVNYPALKQALTEKLDSPCNPDSPPNITTFDRFATYQYLPQFSEHHKERLREIGQLAAALDGDPGNPLGTILRFFEFDETDEKIVLESHNLAKETTSG